MSEIGLMYLLEFDLVLVVVEVRLEGLNESFLIKFI